MAESGSDGVTPESQKVSLCGKCPLRAKEFKTYAFPSIYVPKLEDDYPIPADGLKHDRIKRIVSLPVYRMKIGQSFWHPWPWSELCRSLVHLEVTRGWKFDHCMEGIGTRLWRIK